MKTRTSILKNISLQLLLPFLLIITLLLPLCIFFFGSAREFYHVRLQNNARALEAELSVTHPLHTTSDGQIKSDSSISFYQERYQFSLYVLNDRQRVIFQNNYLTEGNRLPIPQGMIHSPQASVFYQILNSSRGRLLCFSIPSASYRVIMLFPVAQFITLTPDALFYLNCFFGVLLILLCIDILILRNYVCLPIKQLLSYIRKFNITDTPPAFLNWGSEIGQLFSAYYNRELNYKKNLETISILNKEKRANDLEVLQNQINSHFIYNTLNNIQWLAMQSRTDDVIKTVQNLDILLKACSHNEKELVTIEEELNYVIAYLTTQQIRFRNVFDFSFDIDPLILQMKIPKFILQPIVENSIYHGFIDPKREHGHIDISIKRRGKNGHKIDIMIYDNGIGIEEKHIFEVLSNLHKTSDRYMGVAIGNINKRIHLLCGRDYGLGIQSKYQSFTKVDITIPVIL